MTKTRSNQTRTALHTSTDPSAESICTRVVDAVADARLVDPLDLTERLFDVVDPDALENLFEPGPFGVERARGEVRFVMAGCDVVVEADGTVTATPNEE